MEKCYINGMGCVSVQNTFEDEFLENPIDYSETNIIRALKPNYKEFIPPAAIRRMSSGVKNSIVASTMALNEAGNEELDGIITGTGMGCIQDSEKFLDKMIEFNEEFLTPTSFIQSTHNTVGGQIALNLKCTAYNFTYVNTGSSFQSALMDGLMQIKDEGKNNILIGGIDEIADYTFKLYQEINHIKKDGLAAYSIHENKSEGCVLGEASVFFALGNQKKESSYAEIVDTQVINRLDENNVGKFVSDFLHNNSINSEEIDAVILGNNGDVNFDSYYEEVEKMFESSDLIYYKHLFGEFMTSTSVAVWLASQMIKKEKIPKVLLRDNQVQQSKNLRNILIYNQYRGREHSLILIKNV